MTIKLKKELKKRVQDALRRKYGFSPKINDITLLEATSDGDYIYCYVRENYPYLMHGNVKSGAEHFYRIDSGFVTRRDKNGNLKGEEE